ncbi:hypothetical protein FXO38_21857 [Capsicum annuum]|nr:hypothetical protein FXO38_21857 [Capsicum annuum]
MLLMAIETLNRKIDSMGAKINSLDLKVDSLEGSVSLISGRVDFVEGRQTTSLSTPQHSFGIDASRFTSTDSRLGHSRRTALDLRLGCFHTSKAGPTSKGTPSSIQPAPTPQNSPPRVWNASKVHEQTILKKDARRMPYENELKRLTEFLPKNFKRESFISYHLAPRGKFISYFRSCKLISKGFLYHPIRVKDSNTESPSLQSVPVVNKFLKDFPDDLLGIPPDKEIDFGYYRRFVESFSSIASPLTRLTQEKAKFLWFDSYENSFEKLKDKLTTVLVLTLPEGTKGFVMCCDASRVRLGCVLMQHVKKKQAEDPILLQIMNHLGQQKVMEFEISGEGILRTIAILDRQVQKLRSKEIVLIKVLWKNQKAEEAAWESEDDMCTRYPNLFETVDDDI